MNCSAMPKSCALTAAIAFWRSSLLLPSTRTWSPWIWVWTLAPLDCTNFVISLVFSSAMPGHDRHGLAHVALRGGVDLAFGERLQRDVALDDLLLQDLERGLQPVLGGGCGARSSCRPGEIPVLGVLEVESLARSRAAAWSTALRTSCRSTSDTMSKRELVFRHAREDTVSVVATVDRGFATMSRPGRMPEWPKGAVCKIAGVAYGGSNPPPPTDRLTNQQLSPSTSHPLDAASLRRSQPDGITPQGPRM